MSLMACTNQACSQKTCLAVVVLSEVHNLTCCAANAWMKRDQTAQQTLRKDVCSGHVTLEKCFLPLSDSRVGGGF